MEYAIVAPTIKHLFNGFDITIFAYGSTGTGKTHTMRGGKSLAERGVIPRLLSGIYRRGRKIDKDSASKTTVEISLSYYEIYNDKVFDLFEAPEKRTMAGLPLRESNGKTIVVGLTERPCESLKDFEKLYDQANVNRSTGATKVSSDRRTLQGSKLISLKLNAHSSRSHAILGIKVAVSTNDEVRISTASAIDLAGSEDNRRTENGKERLVESANINKSLFILAQCVEAISEKKSRIPYRESKMTRILSLGQNNGLTLMILNLAPVRSFHLDTLSSLNFANRTKKIEVREIENEPVFKGCPRAVPEIARAPAQRRPLRPLTTAVHNATINNISISSNQKGGKPAKQFSVYSDRARSMAGSGRPLRLEPIHSSPQKRPCDLHLSGVARPPKRRSPNPKPKAQSVMSKETIEDIIEKKVTDILAARALDQPSIAPVPEIGEDVQRRLELLEQKIEGKDDEREQGLTFLLMAKQHSVRGEFSSALKMYCMAKDYFPNNVKLQSKIDRLQAKMEKKAKERLSTDEIIKGLEANRSKPQGQRHGPLGKVEGIATDELGTRKGDEDYHEVPVPASDGDYDTADSSEARSRRKRKARRPRAMAVLKDEIIPDGEQSPRTKRLLAIINTGEARQIRSLKGVGAKKVEAILEGLHAGEADDGMQGRKVGSLGQLARMKGVGAKSVENMRLGVGDFLIGSGGAGTYVG